MSGQSPQYPPPDPRGQPRPLDYRVPPPADPARSTGRQVLRVLFFIFVALVVGFFLLLGTCFLAMRK